MACSPISMLDNRSYVTPGGRNRARPAGAAEYPEGMADSTCITGVCGSEVPPLVGSVLTGTGLTLRQAALALEAGERPSLSDVQRRLVEHWAETHLVRSG